MQNKKRTVLLGDEAVAQAALDSGLSGIYAYPGTPSTEIMEYVQRSPQAAEGGVHRRWSANEKTAVEEALGMSYAGRRAMACMKHVGLNVAADPFVNAAITGAHGGLVVVVADDPSMHSSQNEQDSRAYAAFAQVPLFEPRNQQQAYDMVRSAFALSEAKQLPVLVRLTTRLAHSRADILRREPEGQRPVSFPEDQRRFILLPGNARVYYRKLLDKQEALQNESTTSDYNEWSAEGDPSLGIITAGLARNYLDEWFADGPPHPLFHVGQYPLPRTPLAEWAAPLERLLVVEEGAPFIEEQLRGLLPTGKTVQGRLDGTLPRTGELSPDAVARALGREVAAPETPETLLKARPPQLCRGCPHIDAYVALQEALKDYPNARVFSDIGCYTLGALPPFEAIHSCVDMGASITMAKGAADAGVQPSLAVIGDSTFTHSGMTGLLDAVYEDTRVVIVILDNDTTAMTGRQESLAAGRLESICAGLGVPEERLRVFRPHRSDHEQNVAVLREEIEAPGVSVVIARRPCIHLKRSM